MIENGYEFLNEVFHVKNFVQKIRIFELLLFLDFDLSHTKIVPQTIQTVDVVFLPNTKCLVVRVLATTVVPVVAFFLLE